jgi:hypothetical protein
MYENFLLYGILVISSIIVIVIFIAYFIDAIFCLFGKKIECTIVNYQIIPVGRKFYLGQWHSINVLYEYEFLNIKYQSTMLNSANSVMRLSYENSQKLLNKLSVEKRCYMLPFASRLSIVFPFKEDGRFYFGFILCLMCITFSTLKLGLVP